MFIVLYIVILTIYTTLLVSPVNRERGQYSKMTSRERMLAAMRREPWTTHPVPYTSTRT